MSMRETARAEAPFALIQAVNRVARRKDSGKDAASNAGAKMQKTPEQTGDLPRRQPPKNEEFERWPLPGLAPMTRVRANFGDVPAVALRKGDMVLSRSGDYFPIIWITRIKLDEHILIQKPDSNPIVIAPGALGSNLPSHEMMLSPRQVVVADNISDLASSREVAMLISRPGVRRLRETSLSYTLFHVGKPEDIYCEGLYLHFPLDS